MGRKWALIAIVVGLVLITVALHRAREVSADQVMARAKQNPARSNGFVLTAHEYRLSDKGDKLQSIIRYDVGPDGQWTADRELVGREGHHSYKVDGSGVIANGKTVSAFDSERAKQVRQNFRAESYYLHHPNLKSRGVLFGLATFTLSQEFPDFIMTKTYSTETGLLALAVERRHTDGSGYRQTPVQLDFK